jgi:hypothetical protein
MRFIRSQKHLKISGKDVRFSGCPGLGSGELTKFYQEVAVKKCKIDLK